MFQKDKIPPIIPASFISPLIKGYFYSGTISDTFFVKKARVRINLNLPKYTIESVWTKKTKWIIKITDQKMTEKAIESLNQGHILTDGITPTLSYSGAYSTLPSEVKTFIDYLCDLTKKECKQYLVRYKLGIVQKEITTFKTLLPEIERLIHRKETHC